MPDQYRPRVVLITAINKATALKYVLHLLLFYHQHFINILFVDIHCGRRWSTINEDTMQQLTQQG
jgi:hypothetical protein